VCGDEVEAVVQTICKNILCAAVCSDMDYAWRMRVLFVNTEIASYLAKEL